MMFYVVTDGIYSDYKICGVFDDPDLAEKFRSHYNYDTVEEHKSNPMIPRSDMDKYLFGYCIDNSKTQIRRANNERKSADSLKFSYWGNSRVISKIISARDEAHANKIAADLIAGFLGGSLAAYETTHIRIPPLFEPGDDFKYVECIKTYMMVHGMIEMVHEETI